MPLIWKHHAHDSGHVRDLVAQLRISSLVAEVLVARGVDSQENAQKFLSRRLGDLHDPENLPGVANAADRVVAALAAKRRITIYGDYDVDGVTATSLLYHCFQLAGGQVDYYIPSRLDEGYGLNTEAIRKLHMADPNQLVVSVDCGICSTEEARVARELGLELIVTDHHQFGSELPDAAALVHPRLAGSYPFGELCGVGVAFKLAWAVCTRLGDGKKASPRMREFLLSAIGLAAIGTIADMVPLVDENRVIVHYGLGSLVGRANPGLKALLKVAKKNPDKLLTTDDIGFDLAPRINAAGRLGQARLAVELLTTENQERADVLANYLDDLNKNRRTVESRMLKQAKELVNENPAWEQDRSLVLAHADWHAGVIGVVAGRIAEHFQRPALLIAIDDQKQLGQGSGRSYQGFNLHAGLTACADLLVTFGGHHAAVGLKIAPANLDSLRKRLSAFVAANHSVLPGEGTLSIDSEVMFSQLTVKAIKELDLIGPFGMQNPKPVFCATGVELAAPPKKMGDGERHLAVSLRQHNQVIRGVAFGKADWADELAKRAGPFSVAFQPNINTFRDQESVEMRLLDWQ